MGAFKKLKIGERFTLRGEDFKKVTDLTYKSIAAPSLGEIYIDPRSEALINKEAPVARGIDCSARSVFPDTDGQQIVSDPFNAKLGRKSEIESAPKLKKAIKPAKKKAAKKVAKKSKLGVTRARKR